MRTSDSQQPTPFQKGHGKDTHFEAQMKKVFAVFKRSPATMLMVEKETGVMRSNITWYVREWRQEGKIFLVKHGACPVSKHPKVGFYTTNPDLVQTSTPKQ